MVPPDALSGRVCARILNLMVMLWPGASAGMVHCSGPLVAFSAVTWVLRWTAPSGVSSVTRAEPQPMPELDATAVARSLGAAPVQAVAAPSLASRFQLLGVLAGGPNAGAALIAVDGKPAKPFRVGAVVSDGLVLQSAQGRRVSLGVALDGTPTLTLDLPVKK